MTPLPNLHGAKTADRVHHTITGLTGKVGRILPAEDAPLEIIWDDGNAEWYYMDGKMFPEDLNPTVCFGDPVARVDFPGREGSRLCFAIRKGLDGKLRVFIEGN